MGKRLKEIGMHCGIGESAVSQTNGRFSLKDRIKNDKLGKNIKERKEVKSGKNVGLSLTWSLLSMDYFRDFLSEIKPR